MAGSDVQIITLPNATASTTSVAAAQTTSGTAALNLATAAGTGAFNPAGQASLISFTSTGNISGITLTIIGTDIAGNAQTETRAGPNNNTVNSAKFYRTVTSVAGGGSIGTNMSVGIAASTSGTQAVAFAGRARVKSIHCTTGGTIGDLTFFNGSPNLTVPDSKFSLRVATTTKDYLDPIFPDNGVLFEDGAYITLPAGISNSLTVFFN
tara:strand:- start:499 stop:1125 length:627 start_codon:yes stop_codon:yes gene_type:complete